mgnify:CR=1 FL=1
MIFHLRGKLTPKQGKAVENMDMSPKEYQEYLKSINPKSPVWKNVALAFLVGGALCMIGEILLLKTKLTPARILVGYIVAGVILSAIGVYAPLAQFAGAGASVPLTGFGHALVTGVKRAVQEIGFLGAFTGGLTNTAAGISAAVFFGVLMALIFQPRAKE